MKNDTFLIYLYTDRPGLMSFRNQGQRLCRERQKARRLIMAIKRMPAKKSPFRTCEVGGKRRSDLAREIPGAHAHRPKSLVTIGGEVEESGVLPEQNETSKHPGRARYQTRGYINQKDWSKTGRNRHGNILKRPIGKRFRKRKRRMVLTFPGGT